MAGSKGDYLEDKILDHVLGGAEFEQLATVYVHLYTAAPSDAGAGTEVSTGDWSNYARVAVTNNGTNWSTSSGGSKHNDVAISFGTATIVSPVHVEAFAIKDASGNLLYWGDLTVPKDITDGDPVSFPIGSLVVTEA